MSNALDYVRNSCGIAGEEVAEMVDSLEKQRDELVAALDAAKSAMVKAKAVSGWDNVPYDLHVEIDKIFAALAKLSAGGKEMK